jgi:hypothetical protein
MTLIDHLALLSAYDAAAVMFLLLAGLASVGVLSTQLKVEAQLRRSWRLTGVTGWWNS